MTVLMTQLIALLSLSVLSLLVTVGNFWFTYGIWPRSWIAFVFFGMAQALTVGLIQFVAKSKP